MTRKTETKHEAFMRLMQRRLERSLAEMRLVSQLSSQYYENTPEEAEEVITHLDKAVNNIATLFQVPYSTAIGAAAHRAAQTRHLTTSAKRGKIDEVDIAKAMDLIKRGNSDEALSVLRTALLQEVR